MKILCIGRNYVKHAKELGNEVPKVPVFFMKPDSALLHKNQAFYIPDFSNNLQYEAEIVLKICRPAKHIEAKFAHRCYNEIGIGIDFTARDVQKLQKEKGLPWEIAKAFDNSAPLSKFLQKTDLPKHISFSLQKNGATVQQGNTADMLFSFDEIIAYLSQFVTLKIGDLIFTGTPAGVGQVNPGDRLTAYIEEQEMMNFQIK